MFSKLIRSASLFLIRNIGLILSTNNNQITVSGFDIWFTILMAIQYIILGLHMTEDEKKQLYEAIKRNAPDWFERIKQQLVLKKAVISNCIAIASHSDDDDYQEEINRVYNTVRCPMNDTETILLNYICLIRHKEHVNNGIQKDDPDIQKWLRILVTYRDRVRNKVLVESVVDCLDKYARQIILEYGIKLGVGRPKGKGKQVFSYNGKEYHTIQECADDYNITKQGMHKRLKKLQII